MENENKVTVKQLGLRYGLILGLIFIVYNLILQFTGLATNNWMSIISNLALLITIVMAHKAFKEGGDGYMSMGQGLGIGTLISLVSGIISSVFIFIYLKFVDDSMLGLIKEKQLEQFEKQGLSDAQIEQQMKIAEMFSGPIAILIMGIIITVFAGFIISLIVSLFTKKSKKIF